MTAPRRATLQHYFDQDAVIGLRPGDVAVCGYTFTRNLLPPLPTARRCDVCLQIVSPALFARDARLAAANAAQRDADARRALDADLARQQRNVDALAALYAGRPQHTTMLQRRANHAARVTAMLARTWSEI